MVSHKKESKIKDINRTEEVLIDADEGSKDQDPMKENELILHQPYHTYLCNEAEYGGNEKVINTHEGSASGNMREMEPVLSPDREKGGPTPCTTGTEHALLRSSDTRPLDNKNGEVDKARVATGIIVTPAETGKKPATVISYIEPFNLRLWNTNDIRS